MEKYFDVVYRGEPFQLFGVPHLIAIGIITLGGLSYFYFRKIWGEREKKIMRLVFAIAILISESSLHIWSLYWGIWDVKTTLPLHACSVVIWLSIYMLLTKNYPIYEWVYFLGLGGAMQAVLTPADAAAYNFPHFRIMQTFTSHGLLINIAIYMTVVEGFRPTWQSFKRIFIWLNVYMVAIFFLNLAIGSNYLFVAGKPEFPTLLDALAPWPWYILELEAVGFAIFFILYIPFLIKDLRAKKQQQIPA